MGTEPSLHCSLTGWREPVNVVVVSEFTVSGGGTSVQKPDMAWRATWIEQQIEWGTNSRLWGQTEVLA